MKVLHVASSYDGGGAARAAYRIHLAQIRNGIDSQFLAVFSKPGGSRVISPKKSFFNRLRRVFAPALDAGISMLQKPFNSVLHSPGFTSSLSVREINTSSAEIVNLHWVQGGALSTLLISRIKKPIVWTLHDTWAFSGCEHYDGGVKRWEVGYSGDSRPFEDSGIDLNWFSWSLKKFLWRKPFNIVGPSNWISTSALASSLMANWPVVKIPNPIDTEVWRPVDKQIARETLGLPLEAAIIAFGASKTDKRKGFDLFIESLDLIQNLIPKAKFVAFGTSDPEDMDFGNHAVTFLGDLRDDVSLRLAYSAADVFVIPSRQDNLPNTGIESQACGTPVVAFNVGGLEDVVLHLSTGYLAKPFSVKDFASGINWAYQESLNGKIKERCIEYVNSIFSEEKVAGHYRKLYANILST